MFKKRKRFLSISLVSCLLVNMILPSISLATGGEGENESNQSLIVAQPDRDLPTTFGAVRFKNLGNIAGDGKVYLSDNLMNLGTVKREELDFNAIQWKQNDANKIEFGYSPDEGTVWSKVYNNETLIRKEYKVNTDQAFNSIGFMASNDVITGSIKLQNVKVNGKNIENALDVTTGKGRFILKEDIAEAQNGFVVNADLVLSGTLGKGEHSKVEISFGYDNIINVGNGNGMYTLPNAIKASRDGDIINVYPGNYGLKPDPTWNVDGQAGWYLPIERNNLTIQGVDANGNPIDAKPDITTELPLIYGADTTNNPNLAWASQNLITIFGSNLRISGLEFMPKVEPNKTIEVLGTNTTIEYCRFSPNTKNEHLVMSNIDGYDYSLYGGSLYFNEGKIEHPEENFFGFPLDEITNNITVRNNYFKNSGISFDSAHITGNKVIESNTFDGISVIEGATPEDTYYYSMIRNTSWESPRENSFYDVIVKENRFKNYTGHPVMENSTNGRFMLYDNIFEGDDSYLDNLAINSEYGDYGKFIINKTEIRDKDGLYDAFYTDKGEFEVYVDSRFAATPTVTPVLTITPIPTVVATVELDDAVGEPESVIDGIFVKIGDNTAKLGVNAFATIQDAIEAVNTDIIGKGTVINVKEGKDGKYSLPTIPILKDLKILGIGSVTVMPSNEPEDIEYIPRKIIQSVKVMLKEIARYSHDDEFYDFIVKKVSTDETAIASKSRSLEEEQLFGLMLLTLPRANVEISNITFDCSSKRILSPVIAAGPINFNKNTVLGVDGGSNMGFGIMSLSAKMCESPKRSVGMTAQNEEQLEYWTSITGNTFSDIKRVGIGVYGDNDEKTLVSNNAYTGKGPNNNLDYGINIAVGGHADIVNNNITNCKGILNRAYESAAIWVESNISFLPADVSIKDNKINNNRYGIAIGRNKKDTSKVIINENRIINSDAKAISYLGQGILADEVNLSSVGKSAVENSYRYPAINARYNYFGTGIRSEVDNLVEGNVDYRNFYIDEGLKITSGDINLATLAVDNISLTSKLNPTDTQYTVEVPNGTSRVTVKATAMNPTAKVEINNVAGAQIDVTLSAEETTLPIKVTSQEEDTAKEYSLKITKSTVTNSHGSHGGSSSYVPASSTTSESVTSLLQGNINKVQAIIIADSNGNASVSSSLSDKILAEIDKLIAAKTSNITLLLNVDGDYSQTCRVIIPDALVKSLDKKGIKNIEVLTNIGQINLTVKTLLKGNNSDYVLEIKRCDTAQLAAAEKNIAGSAQVFQYTLLVDSKVINKKSTVLLPYQLKADENPNSLTVISLLDNGKLANLGGRYISSQGVIEFITKGETKFFVKLMNTQFNDIGNFGWANEQINSLYAKGVIGGISDGNYGPELKLTRAQYAVMLVNFLKLSNDGTQLEFTDVPRDAWYYNQVAAAVQNGLIKGKSSTIFGPDEYISRQDIAVMTTRTFSFKEVSLSNGSISFKDLSSIHDYAKGSINDAVNAGIMRGNPDGTFRPLGNVTRAEAAVVMFNLLNK